MLTSRLRGIGRREKKGRCENEAQQSGPVGDTCGEVYKYSFGEGEINPRGKGGSPGDPEQQVMHQQRTRYLAGVSNSWLRDSRVSVLGAVNV